MKAKISKIIAGDKKSFHVLFTELYPLLHNIAIQYVNEVDDAKDIVQNAFLKLWENRQTIKQNSNLRNYLFTLVKNACIDYIRKKQNYNQHVSSIYNVEFDVNLVVLEETSYEEYEKILTNIELAVDSLPEKCRDVFKLSKYNKLSNKEVSTKLKISIKTVEAQLSKATKILRSELQPNLSIISILFVDFYLF
jgi:RNA polymerase sigma-70 factor (ECF subfamily)